jgi:hypothetical protein
LELDLMAVVKNMFRHLTLKMGRIYGPETLVKDHTKATLGNSPKVTTSYRNPGGILRSHSCYLFRILNKMAIY